MIPPLPTIKLAVTGVWAAALAAMERWRPASPRPPHSDAPRLTRNLALWLANTLMNPVLTAPIAVAAAAAPLWSRPAAWQAWWAPALDFLVLDLWIYAWHRANHEWPLLWRFHEIHHRDAFLDVSSGVRFHPGEVLISALARAPLIIALDLPLASVLAFDGLVTIAALFHHSNVRLPAGLEALLRQLVVTPSHHWVHHHAVRRDTDSNYGAVLTLWDRVLGTWSPTVRTPGMAIGAEGAPDLPLAALAARPFHGAGRP